MFSIFDRDEIALFGHIHASFQRIFLKFGWGLYADILMPLPAKSRHQVLPDPEGRNTLEEKRRKQYQRLPPFERLPIPMQNTPFVVLRRSRGRRILSSDPSI